ncbi:MFS transporter [Candidatus Bathyarchaeota archaeon]|nr:MFS transporter [Candidatus Bathyarchaeota archaeon]
MTEAEQDKEQRGMFWFIRGNIKVLMICRILWSWSTSMVYPFFSLYVLALGGSHQNVGLISSIGILAGMFLYPVGGFLADKSGRVKLIGYSTVFYALAHIFFVIAPTWQWLAVGQFLSQFLLFYVPAMNALSSDSLPPNVRGKGFAIMMAVPGAIRILSPYMGGLLIEYFQETMAVSEDLALIRAVRIAWTIAFLTGLLVAYLRLRYLTETIEVDESDSYSYGDLFRILKDSYRSIFESIKWMDRSLKTIVVIEVIAAFFVALSAPFYVIYATEIVNITAPQWGDVNLISGVVALIFALPMGQIVDNWGAKRSVLVGMLAGPVVIYLYQYANSYLHVVAVITVIALCNKIMIPGFSTLIANMIPRERRGRLYSLLGERGVSISWGNFWGGGFLIFPAAAAGAWVGGQIYAFDPNLVWQITSGALLLSALLVILLVKEPETAQV